MTLKTKRQQSTRAGKSTSKSVASLHSLLEGGRALEKPNGQGSLEKPNGQSSLEVSSVSGDQLVVDNTRSLTGKVHIRSDGKKVRAKKPTTLIGPEDRVEIVEKPDGTKVRRITRKKKKTSNSVKKQDSNHDHAGQTKNDLGGFLASQKLRVRSGSKTRKKSSLTTTGSVATTIPRKTKAIDGAASVAGDQLTVDKKASVTGKIYVRPDGKRVMLVKTKRKKTSKGSVSSRLDNGTTENGRAETITRDDGTKVRGVYKKKTTAKKKKRNEGATVGTHDTGARDQRLVDDNEVSELAKSRIMLGAASPAGVAEADIPESSSTETAQAPVEVPVKTMDGRPDSIKASKQSCAENDHAMAPEQNEAIDHARETRPVVPATPIAHKPKDAPAGPVSASAGPDDKNLCHIVHDGSAVPDGFVLVPKTKIVEAERRQKRLEKILASNGITVVDEIDYETCVKNIQRIGIRMEEIGSSDVKHPDKAAQDELQKEYYILEQDMKKYESALVLTEEYIKEQIQAEEKWEKDNQADNEAALKKVRRHMPVDIRKMSEAMLTSDPSPNNKFLPKPIAKKFIRTNVLQLLRRDPKDIIRVHPQTLMSMRVVGLTLTERWALHAHLLPCGKVWKTQQGDKLTKEKLSWYEMMRNNFKESLEKFQRHVNQCGPPRSHEGCMLIGKQCPLRADKAINYDDDYGWPDGEQYEITQVQKALGVEDTGAKAIAEAKALAEEKKANERTDALRVHYKGKLLQLTGAIGSCESMDEAMDKMEHIMMSLVEEDINYDRMTVDLGADEKYAKTKKELSTFISMLKENKFLTSRVCERSGVAISGDKKNDQSSNDDIRSSVECYLADDYIRTIRVFEKFVKDRMSSKHGNRDQRVTALFDVLDTMLVDLGSKNKLTLRGLGVPHMPAKRLRVVKTQKDMENEIIKKEKNESIDLSPQEASRGGRKGSSEPSSKGSPVGNMPKLGGGLLDAIKNKGKKTTPTAAARADPTGLARGGLLDAIKARSSVICV